MCKDDDENTGKLEGKIEKVEHVEIMEKVKSKTHFFGVANGFPITFIRFSS